MDRDLNPVFPKTLFPIQRPKKHFYYSETIKHDEVWLRSLTTLNNLPEQWTDYVAVFHWKVLGNWIDSCLWKNAMTKPTLLASLSGTFLQTLPDLVTSLKGHSLSPRSCPPTQSAPSERFGYWYDCRSNLVPKHARKHEAHPPRVKKEFRLDSNDFRLIWAGVSNMVSYKTNVWYTLSCL